MIEIFSGTDVHRRDRTPGGSRSGGIEPLSRYGSDSAFDLGVAGAVYEEATLTRVQQVGGIEAPAQVNKGWFQSPGRLALDFDPLPVAFN
jgi:hypothetical protein